MKWKEWTVEELLDHLWQDGLDLVDEVGGIVSMTYVDAYPGLTIIGPPNWFPEPEPLVDENWLEHPISRGTNCNWRSDPALSLDRPVDEQRSRILGSVLVHHPDWGTVTWYIISFARKGEEVATTRVP